MSGIINKVKDALSKDDKTHEGTTGTTTTGTGITGSSAHTTGTGHTTGLPTGTTTTTTGSTNAGPHSSNLANKADPRVDSDLGELNTMIFLATETDNRHRCKPQRGSQSNHCSPCWHYWDDRYNLRLH